MTTDAGPGGGGDAGRLRQLVERLAEIQREIEQLSGGQADAITLPGGGALLMPGAQSELRDRGEVERRVARQRQAILDALPAYVGVLDGDGTVVSANRAWRDFGPPSGSDHDGHMGWNYLAVCDDAARRGVETAAAAGAGIADVLARRRDAFALEYGFEVSLDEAGDPDEAGRRAFRLEAAPLGPEPDAGAVVMHVDMTAERRAQARLRESERQHRLMFELSPLPKVVYDLQSHSFLAANEAACSHFGYAEDELLGRTLFDVTHPDDHERLRSVADAAPDADRHDEWLQVTRDGGVMEVEIDSHALDYDGRAARLAVLRDVSERNRDERVRRAVSELLENTWRADDIDTALCRFLEHLPGIQRGATGLLMVFERDSLRVDRCVAPGLSESLCNAFDRVEFGSDPGPSGNAPNVRELVVVDDLESDSQWRPASGAAYRAGYRTLWAHPVLDGERRTVAMLLLLFDQPASPDAGIEAVLRQITQQAFVAIDRWRQQQALVRSQSRLSKVFSEAAAGILMLDRDGVVVQANRPMQEMLGDALEGSGLADWADDDDRPHLVVHLNRLIAQERSESDVEARFRCSDDELRWLRLRMTAGAGENGAAGSIIVVAEDVSEQRRAQRELRRQQRLNEVAGRLAHVGGWSIDVDTGVHRWSDEVFRIFEREAESTPDREQGMMLFPEEDRHRLGEALERLTERGTPYDLLLRATTEKGRDIVVRAIGHPESDHEGRVRRIFGAVQDVSEQQELEEMLQRERRLLDIAGRVARIGGWAIDVRTGEHHWGQELFRIFERESGEQPSVDEALALFAADDRPALRSALDRLMHDGTPYDLTLRATTEQGRAIHLRTQGHAELDPSDRVRRVYGAAQDVTDRVHQERERRQLAGRLQSMLEHMGEGFMLIDEGDRVVFVNATAREVLGMTEDSALGRSIWDVMPGAVGTEVQAQYERTRRTGEPAQFETWYEPLENWFYVHGYSTDEGVAVYFRVTTEERELQRQLEQAQRMETLGQLTGGFAHDFNNLLTVIAGNAEILTEALDRDDELEPLAEMIGEAAGRGSEMTQRLLAFARRQPLEPKPADLNQLIAESLELIEKAAGDETDTRFEPGDDLPAVSIDQAQFESALLNLALNAHDAMPDGGTLTIETRNETVDETKAAQDLDLQPGEYVVVAVTDSGAGMEPETAERIFEPFFTTKPKGQGTGLGLPMIHGFVGQSGGDVRVYSEPGRGTTFRMYFPSVDAEPDAADRPTDRPVREGRGERILVVEDNDLVRDLALRQLEDLGYRVAGASDGADALARLERDDGVDLLFTDVVMPGDMDGPELAARARAIRPELRVLFTSGYTDHAVVRDGRLDPGAHLLGKPYGRDDLARAVAYALEPRSR